MTLPIRITVWKILSANMTLLMRITVWKILSANMTLLMRSFDLTNQDTLLNLLHLLFSIYPVCSF